MDYKEVLRIKERAEPTLRKIPGVHAVGIGPKETNGRPTDQLAIKVYVVRKRPLGEIPASEQIPPEIDGVPTDVYETPVPQTLQVSGAAQPFMNDEERYRPIRGGIQINRVGQGQGTLGCIFTVRDNPNLILGVTNHHVLYEKCSDAADGEAVGQPTETDSCTDCCSSIVGHVHRSVCDIDLDIALVRLNSGLQWLAEVQQSGFVTGGSFVTAADAMSHTFQVTKRGRTTSLTGGVILDLEIGGTINNPDGTVFRTFAHAMRIQPNLDASGSAAHFAHQGDSGSAILNSLGQVVGILFGANLSPGGVCMAIPLDLVIAKFDMMPGAQRLQLSVATATALNDVRVVPRVTAPELATETALPPPVVAAAPVPELEQDLSRTETGRWFLDAYLRHAREVRQLINENRRVATIWHRSGAAELFQALVQVVRRPSERVPAYIQGRPISVCLDHLSSVLRQYGSAALARDLAVARPSLPAMVGLTYAEILEHLQHTHGAGLAA